MGKRGIALTGLLLLVALLRLRFLDFPLTRDEGDYAYMAQLWLQGVLPYSGAYDMRMPGIFAAYAVILAVFGQTAWGIHLGLWFVHVASAALLYGLGRRLLDPTAGFVAAFCFVILGMNPWVHGAVANTEHFVLLPAIAGFLVLLRGLESGRQVTVGAAGVLLGLALVTKQSAAPLLLFGAIYVGWRAPRQLAVYLLGAVVPFAVVCGGFAASGGFDSFWFWTVSYPREYLTSLPLEGAWANFSEGFPASIRWTLGFWLLAAVGVSAFFWSEPIREQRGFLLGLLVFSFLAVCPGFFFRPQHFLLLLPGIALLCGVAASSLVRRGVPGGPAAVAALVALPVLAFAVGEREFLFRADGHAASRKLFGANPFPESREIARYLAEHSAEEDEIAIFGSEPQIFFYAARRSATPFILVYEAMQPHEYARLMQEEMIAAMEATPPRFLVFVNIPYSWLVTPQSESLLFDWFTTNAPRDYRQVGQVNLLSNTETEYLWEPQGEQQKPSSRFWLSVWERKTAPPPST